MLKAIGTTMFAIAALSALIVGGHQVNQANQQQIDQHRAQHLEPEDLTLMFDAEGMVYEYPSSETPDINQLLADYPTAAGLIREQVRGNLAYEAAVEGDYEQAYRQMALAFKDGNGSGSYAEKW
ncbi:hypothetical protein [Ferrimonas aestuarii]|uniref:Uncharacterized protein n=1 Tax=Ferrimonas aestuarii TaxID=2569539 RepID=A0A4U1BMV0_9GAMM|nr:hypothetical protein [Ferrimonas aestuarii]TKB54274.1 hypothetical protein FCL42_12850 [Ferrimonas aestuarii]